MLFEILMLLIDVVADGLTKMYARTIMDINFLSREIWSGFY